jgi:ADP-ribose pyrophosphatase YjhB (NUDIX family)
MANKLADHLAAFLARHTAPVVETVTWGQLPLQVANYLSPNLPPRTAITSVRAVVVRQGQVLVVRDPESVHILPGGRCEPGERLEQTLARELLEETGWTVGNLALLGFRHFHHLDPRPPAYSYPYPDFCQVVYAAAAQTYRPEAIDRAGYELEASFWPIAAVQALTLTPGERRFLGAAWTNLQGQDNAGSP